ncbi:MAG: DNA repair protein RadA, partial [Micrococcales bacterium]|nr:DNA repair protein RadA [Micrococcales bacterium]
HVTKDGSVAGPRSLEHIVDVVCSFDGERHTEVRLLRASKNRFGPAEEVGCFTLAEDGIHEVADPSGLFAQLGCDPVPGNCLGISMEGRRPMAVEVQALAVSSSAASPRRTTSGVDSSRLAMVLAVLQRRCGVTFGSQDVYASTVGGARVCEPGMDLAVALACASGRFDVPIPPGTCAIGEVGLGGEVRPVRGLDRRLAEAARLGLRRALVPDSEVAWGRLVPGELDVVRVSSLQGAVSAVLAGEEVRVGR